MLGGEAGGTIEGMEVKGYGTVSTVAISTPYRELCVLVEPPEH